MFEIQEGTFNNELSDDMQERISKLTFDYVINTFIKSKNELRKISKKISRPVKL